MIDFVKVGSKIAECRKAKGLSQEDLADKLYITRQGLSKWENGTSIPSIDSLLELCNIFGISFEEMLCLNDDVEVDQENLFANHSRSFIIEKIIDGTIKVNIPDVLYQMSPSERITIIKAIKEDKLKVDLQDLSCKLTRSEMAYLKGVNEYEIKKGSY